MIREGGLIAVVQRSNPWIAASKSIAQDSRFVASLISLIGIYLFQRRHIVRTADQRKPSSAATERGSRLHSSRMKSASWCNTRRGKASFS